MAHPPMDVNVRASVVMMRVAKSTRRTRPPCGGRERSKRGGEGGRAREGWERRPFCVRQCARGRRQGGGEGGRRWAAKQSARGHRRAALAPRRPAAPQHLLHATPHTLRASLPHATHALADEEVARRIQGDGDGRRELGARGVCQCAVPRVARRAAGASVHDAGRGVCRDGVGVRPLQPHEDLAHGVLAPVGYEERAPVEVQHEVLYVIADGRGENVEGVRPRRHARGGGVLRCGRPGAQEERGEGGERGGGAARRSHGGGGGFWRRLPWRACGKARTRWGGSTNYDLRGAPVQHGGGLCGGGRARHGNGNEPSRRDSPSLPPGRATSLYPRRRGPAHSSRRVGNDVRYPILLSAPAGMGSVAAGGAPGVAPRADSVGLPGPTPMSAPPGTLAPSALETRRPAGPGRVRWVRH